MLYTILLTLHNLTRWLVLAAAFWALVRSIVGWLGQRPWTEQDRRAGVLFTVGLDIQFALGLSLTFVSPSMRAAFSNMAAAVQNPQLRFFLYEHIPLMFIALLAAHFTNVLARRAASDHGKHRRATLGYALATLVICVSIPWGGRLFRFFN